MRNKLIKNFPRLKCDNCAQQLQPYETWAANNDGFVFLVNIDMWPTYYRDVGEHRHEFCNPTCVLSWAEKHKLA